MEHNLENYFDNLASKIPPAEDHFIFSESTFDRPLSHLVTDRLKIDTRKHDYHPYCFRVDSLWFYAEKPSYRNLGLLILSVIFCPEPFTSHLKLTSPASNVKNVFIENSRVALKDLSSGYFSQSRALCYWPQEMPRHPFLHFSNTPHELPCFGLTNLEDFVATEEQYENRDTVRLFGTDAGSARFAELLLNASLPESNGVEYDLESESGYRGVGVSSAEVRLILPGHVYWDNF